MSEREKDFFHIEVVIAWWNSVCVYPFTLVVAAGLESLSIKRVYSLVKTSLHLVCGLLVHYRDLPNSLHQAFAFKAGSLPEE